MYQLEFDCNGHRIYISIAVKSEYSLKQDEKKGQTMVLGNANQPHLIYILQP